ncbi:MAG: penicillin-binding protein 2 [Burkholderiaceae bacterium]|jgi:penicillin-binding protein 2
MTEFKDTERELRLFRLRLAAAVSFVLVGFALLAGRLVDLQVVRHSEFAAQAEENRISVVPIPPNRGLILDRNGVVLARNYSAYTLEITPARVTDLDATIDALSEVIEIQPRDRKRFRKVLEESKGLESVPIRTRLTDEEVARFAAQHYRFPGVEIQARLFRQYPLGELAAHVIGYIGRKSQRDIDALAQREDEEGIDLLSNYQGTDYIGKEGLEKRYEEYLHGTTGYEEVEVSAGGHAVRTLSSTPATAGNNLILSLDVDLQQVAEKAFGDRRGALVAIEPESGDVLAFVSEPGFDPNLFVEGIDSQNWDLLNNSPDRPLINRPLTGAYPPGSTFKPFLALDALETGKRTPQWGFNDPGFFMFAGHRFRDDKEGGHGYVDMYRSIVASCDTYYYMLANDLGIDSIASFMKPFGFGQITGIDLDGERTGVLPSPEWKRRFFKGAEQQRWYAGDTVSIGIGQGYNAYTPLQMAHAIATLANDGVVMTPHLVKAIENSKTGERTLTIPKASFRIALKPQNLQTIRDALVGVNKEGTSAAAFKGAGYTSGGKTGTAQLFQVKENEKYREGHVAERLRDHAWFIAYAPADHPRIAVAVLVENGGFGAQAAAPIAREVFDFYLLGKKPSANQPGAAPEIEVHDD